MQSPSWRPTDAVPPPTPKCAASTTDHKLGTTRAQTTVPEGMSRLSNPRVKLSPPLPSLSPSHRRMPVEVEREVCKLSVRKAADLMGLKIKFIQWGGSTLMQFITDFLNQACRDGLPEDWTFRRVVSLYKAGPRLQPESYRTIMVGSIFSKIPNEFWMLA
ncbi:hypothetical protein R1sor_010456 [Riccia sorocarpa]|uniref:Uncharacterized protein n=1 Tax=Riccia sorocarpa TaxID=122646 RepID=A0ABD3I203_9MARC